MSTEDQNRCVVTFKKGVDTDQAVNELLDAGYELHNEKPDSISNFDFVMTRQQAEELKKDDRIVDVRYGSKAENGIIPISTVLDESRNYNRRTTQTNNDYDWAKVVCNDFSDPFGGQTFLNLSYQMPYNLDGTGVDVVIQDSGVDPNHPEWLAKDGVVNRYVQHDWPTVSGQNQYTQSSLHYRDVDGHGTHVAGTTVGRLYGWAKDASLYNIKILDDPGNTFGISASFNMIRGWHNNKGTGRPTIVNMSWGYFSFYTNINGGNYRGTPWSGSTMDPNYGMIQFSIRNGEYTHPVRVASVDSDIQDCINDGIHLVSAAGNSAHKMDVQGGIDYDNYFVGSGTNRYYHRGGTPQAQPGVVCVGNIDYSYTGGQDWISTSSETGPRVDIWAPGSYIQSALPLGSNIANNLGGGVTYPLNSSYIIGKISGTSMASPQVCGVLACILQMRPNLTPAESRDLIMDLSQPARVYDSTGSTGNDYTDYKALQGAFNNFLQQRFNNPQTKKFQGTAFRFST